MKRIITALFLLSVISHIVPAQSVSFPDDSKQRGYYDRPYKRYEAEPGRCTGTGTFLSPTWVQTELQSEASNAIALQLIEKGSYVEWKNDEAADGMVIRFSIPDAEEGRGIKGEIALYVNNKFVQNITLDSYWAWQYAALAGKQTYPDNTPSDYKFARMRFDDVRVKLSGKIPKNARFKLVKADDNNLPYTIDFVELELIAPAVTFESIQAADKVMYRESDGPLIDFIAAHDGKTIYIPEGRFDVADRIHIRKPNTRIIGAGMWYTELFFSASADNAETYAKRGIETNQNNILLEGFFMNTANDRRYFILPGGRNGLVGKGVMGSFGTGSVIRNVWNEHFECGGWIDRADNLTVQHCRFRNHYADGINLASGSKNSVVEHCSFRNNGDDDMASWSSGRVRCEYNTYRYCTAENNWRASSVGFFGGEGHKAHHLVIIDSMEAALRVTTDFPGQPFSDKGMILYEDISVYNAGCRTGPLGFYGDFIDGTEAGAIHITSYDKYDLKNIKFANIDLYNSKWNAVFIDAKNQKMIENLYLENINIYGTGNFGVSFNNAIGNVFYNNLKFYEVKKERELGAIPRWLEYMPSGN